MLDTLRWQCTLNCFRCCLMVRRDNHFTKTWKIRWLHIFQPKRVLFFIFYNNLFQWYYFTWRLRKRLISLFYVSNAIDTTFFEQLCYIRRYYKYWLGLINECLWKPSVAYRTLHLNTAIPAIIRCLAATNVPTSEVREFRRNTEMHLFNGGQINKLSFMINMKFKTQSH